MKRDQTRPAKHARKWPKTTAAFTVLAICVAAAGWYWISGRTTSSSRVAVVDPTLTPADGLGVEPGALAGCNLLLITLDTTRADYLGCYGGSVRTPALDALARRGVLFSHAVTTAPITLPAHASLLTGLYPHHHGARHNGLYRLGDEHHTLTQSLKAAGYATGAVISAFVLDTRFGLGPGFDFYDDDFSDVGPHSHRLDPERKADQATDRAVDWLRANADEPFFLWVHYFDPHAPYDPPAPYDRQYPDDPYAGEVAFMDAEIGRLLEALEQLGRTDDTLIIAVGDHGEGLGEHGELAHGYLLYDATVRIPLIMACGERLGGGTRVAGVVSINDIMPTVLSLLDLPVTPTDGRDLTRAQPAGPVYCESLYSLIEQGWAALFAVFEAQHKYIHGPDPQLFDLSADPRESHDLTDAQPQVAAEMLSRIRDFFGAELERPGAPPATEQLDAADVARLESLGYVGHVADDYVDEPRPDPAKLLPLLQECQSAVAAAANGSISLQQAIRVVGGVLTEHPDFHPAYQPLAGLFFDAGDLPQAESVARRGLELRPENTQLMMSLSRILMRQGNGQEAAALCRRVLATYPGSFDAQIGLAGALLLTREFTEATDVFLSLAKAAPQDVKVCRGLTQAALRSRRTDQAVAVLSAALEAQPGLVPPRLALAAIQRNTRQHAQAIAVLRTGLTLAPDQLDLAEALAVTLLMAPGEWHDGAEAAQIMEAVCQRTNYRQPRYMLTLSAAYYDLGEPQRAIDTARSAQQLALSAGDNDLARRITGAIRRYSQPATKP
jgi:arylsulfatase A-like enzyme/tetratricopeptide (TPR) repeat protein